MSVIVEKFQLDAWIFFRSSNENFQRMRMKLIPNPTFQPHDEASAHRDNISVTAKKSNQQQQKLLTMQISKEALQDNDSPDDSLTEEDLKVSIQETKEVERKAER